ncbi:MAG: hypothetical protein Q7J65_04370, partial [Candidatus Marinimicrobia bacterium]|nr:hypothetical protein [Candidatus Neomarinimicrobiota bacterium]
MYYNTKTATRYPRLLGYILKHRQDIAFSEVARRASSTVVAKLEIQGGEGCAPCFRREDLSGLFSST